MKKPISLIVLAAIHAKEGQQRRALAALAEAAEDPEFDDAIDALNESVEDEVEDVSEDNGDQDEAVADLDEMTDEERKRVFTDSIAEANDDAIEEPDFDDAEDVVAKLVTAGVSCTRIRAIARPILAGIDDGDAEVEDDEGDLQGDVETAGSIAQAARRARGLEKPEDDVVTARMERVRRNLQSLRA